MPKDEILIRKAEMRDMRRVFDLSNDPVVRANSINTRPIEWEGHIKWFASAILDDDVKFYIAETPGGDFVGQVRFQRADNGWIASISVAAEFRNKGFASKMLTAGLGMSNVSPVIAYVKKGNDASLKLFHNHGFTLLKGSEIVHENDSNELFRLIRGGGGVILFVYCDLLNNLERRWRCAA